MTQFGMKHDMFGPQTFEVWQLVTKNFCNCSCGPEMILEFSLVNRDVLQFV